MVSPKITECESDTISYVHHNIKMNIKNTHTQCTIIIHMKYGNEMVYWMCAYSIVELFIAMSALPFGALFTSTESTGFR